MVHKKEEGTYHCIEKLTKEMPGFLSPPGRGLPLLLILEYSGINKEQRIPDRSETAHRKPSVKCFLTVYHYYLVEYAFFFFFFAVSSSKQRSWKPLGIFCCSVTQLCPTFVTSRTAAHQAFLSFTISQSLLKPTCIETIMPSDHLNIYHPFFPCPPSFPASGSFPISQLFASDGQSIGASASVLPINIQG